MIRERIRSWWRKCGRSPFIGDLRLIRIEHRHLYRERMASGDLGWALNALFDAYHSGHFLRDSSTLARRAETGTGSVHEWRRFAKRNRPVFPNRRDQ